MGVLGVMVITIWKSLTHQSDSSIKNSKIVNNGRDSAISDLGFRGTFKEMGESTAVSQLSQVVRQNSIVHQDSVGRYSRN